VYREATDVKFPSSGGMVPVRALVPTSLEGEGKKKEVDKAVIEGDEINEALTRHWRNLTGQARWEWYQ